MTEGTLRLLLGDSLEVLKGFEDNSMGSLISDPPYGLEFMGSSGVTWDAPWKHTFTKPGYSDGGNRRPAPSFTSSRNPTCKGCGKRQRTWEGGPEACSCPTPKFDSREQSILDRQHFQDWCEVWLGECFRVLVPGGIAKVFGGSRMYHRAAAAMDRVGFKDVRLQAWGYGSGFPKSLNLSAALDKHLGNEREVIGSEQRFNEPSGLVLSDRGRIARVLVTRNITRATSKEGLRFEGWGTALKPGWEPFVVGRKP